MERRQSHDSLSWYGRMVLDRRAGAGSQTGWYRAFVVQGEFPPGSRELGSGARRPISAARRRGSGTCEPPSCNHELRQISLRQIGPDAMSRPEPGQSSSHERMRTMLSVSSSISPTKKSARAPAAVLPQGHGSLDRHPSDAQRGSAALEYAAAQEIRIHDTSGETRRTVATIG